MTTPAPRRNCSSAADMREGPHVKFGQSGCCQFHVMSDRDLSLSLMIADIASDKERLYRSMGGSNSGTGGRSAWQPRRCQCLDIAPYSGLNWLTLSYPTSGRHLETGLGVGQFTFG